MSVGALSLLLLLLLSLFVIVSVCFVVPELLP